MTECSDTNTDLNIFVYILNSLQIALTQADNTKIDCPRAGILKCLCLLEDSLWAEL